MTGLFSPQAELGLRNRVVMPAMTRHSTGEGGVPSPELADYYVRRAREGVGLIIVESAAIGAESAGSYISGLQLHSPDHVRTWRPIVERIHAAGSRVWIQIYHGGRLTTPEVTGGFEPLAPSPIPPDRTESRFMVRKGEELVHFQTGTPFPVPREMSGEDIRSVQEAFARSCRRAAEAGFDGVELHGAHGYLLHQFSSALTNRREDKYGPGDLYRFARETARLCREELPPDRVLAYRLSLHRVDLIFVRYDKGEMDFGEMVRQMENDVDVFHCSELRAGLPMFGSRRSLSEEVRSATERPIITCGEIKTRERAEVLFNSGNTDLVAFGRPLIANPGLVKMMESGDMSGYVEFDHDIHTATLI